MLDLALLKAEIECGLYKKPIEEIAKTIHYEPLPGEVRAVVIAAWSRGGLLPREDVEMMVSPRFEVTAMSEAEARSTHHTPTAKIRLPTANAMREHINRMWVLRK
jgi:hypothetical protein